MAKLATMVYLCGHEFRCEIHPDTSKAALAVMQMQAACRDCPECANPQSEPDYMDVHSRAMAAERKARGR